MRSTKVMVILMFSTLLLTTLMIDRAQAGKKKLLKMILLSKLAGTKKKVLIPIPFVFPIKKHHGWHEDHGWHVGGGLGLHGGGGGFGLHGGGGGFGLYGGGGHGWW